MAYGRRQYGGSYQKKRVEYQGPKEAAILRSSKEGWLNVSTPYKKEFVEDLKAFVEPSGRAWNPTTKFWEIKEIYLGTLVEVLKKHFGGNIIQNLTNEQDNSGNMFKPVFAVLKDMPNNEMKRVYNALAFALHPDRGGSNEQMSLLNQAYEEVQK